MAENTKELTAERLREVLDYDLDTGVFRWRKAQKGVAAGAVSGTDNGRGYLLIRVEGRLCRAHRLAWLYVHGRWPTDQLDHINGVKNDNRIANLREATNAENGQNFAVSRRNTSGHPGVNWHGGCRRWHVRIQLAGKRQHIGFFNKFDDAVAARAKAKAEFHAFHPVDTTTTRRTP